jgi:16S rRNA (guanine527-N7)-methyltransferase
MTSPGELDARVAAVHDVLQHGQRLGMLGDRSIGEVIEHAQAFVEALAATTGTVLDLGTGAGVPGLVIAAHRPDLHITLLDRRTARTDFLERQVRRLGWHDRVVVVATDVAQVTRTFDGVVARGFGDPGTTLRAGAPCVAPGGTLIVSEPPHPRIWDDALLFDVGLTKVATADVRVAVFRRA